MSVSLGFCPEDSQSVFSAVPSTFSLPNTGVSKVKLPGHPLFTVDEDPSAVKTSESRTFVSGEQVAS